MKGFKNTYDCREYIFIHSKFVWKPAGNSAAIDFGYKSIKFC